MSQDAARTLHGRYELHRRLARGGMAEVFLARDQLLDRPVAVKVLFPEFATDPAFVERFRREAQAAANLNHPNIVGVYDWGEEAGTYFIVMEYVDGRSLSDIIHSEGPLHPDRAADVAIDIAAALGFAHRNGVVHRDVKPGNVLISPTGQVKVADFGIARAITASAEEHLTQTGAVMGTATYFSPEQAQGLAVDPRSDLYSLGIVLYEMVTGRTPFTGESPVTVAYKHVQEAPPPPRHFNAALPAGLEAIILKLLAKNPANRYPSAEDLRADLRRFREGQTILAEPVMVPPVDATQAVNVTRAQAAYADQTRTAYTEEVPPEEPPRRTAAFVAALVVLVALAIGAAVLFGKAFLSSNDTVAQVAIPSVIDQPVDQATQTLEADGFQVKTVEEKNDAKPKGIVFNQDPPAGEKVDKGEVVTLKVSAGAGQVPVPQVIGQQEDDARRVLTAAGFQVDSRLQPDEEKPKGEVIDQTPKADAEADKGSTVTLVVSSGPADRQVPDVSNLTEAQAANALGQAGLDVGDISTAPSDTIPKGKVVSTNPPAGTDVAKGTKVDLAVSSGPAPKQAQVPDVRGETESQATATLQAAGFQVVVRRQVLPPADPRNGKVIDQSPAGDTSATEGSTVTITVGQAAASTTSSTTSSSTTTTTTGVP